MTHDEWVFADISPLVEELGRERIEDAKVKVMQALPNGSLQRQIFCEMFVGDTPRHIF